jgi:hypothetical protein
MMAKTLFAALLFLLGGALAFSYRVDPAGGPETLAEEVEAAVAAWAEGTDFEATPAEEAAIVFGYGDPSRFGPDLYSLMVSSGSGEAREVRVLLEPGLEALKQRVLLHAVGFLAGLPQSDEGVMRAMIAPESPAVLTDEEREALAALEEFVPEDINRDGVVDFYDLIELARAFGQQGVNLPADINRDGVVDEADLELLRAAYTFGAPAETPPDHLPEPLGPDLPPVPEVGEDFEGEFEEFPDEFDEEFFEDDWLDDDFEDDWPDDEWPDDEWPDDENGG